ncbi:MAG TPA: hypothetical protein VGT07_03270 [Steroidobacteraceae bacterium]|nr:hypothetical protein [Steroidobacteraceae bacterium]
MTSTLAKSAASSGTNIVHRGEAGTGPFMLTLCRLVEPVSIRPPQAPHLRSFTFFTSRERQPDGSEVLYLHMGFFESLAVAERCARALRSRHPDAIASIAPTAFWQGPRDSRRFAPVDNASLTDTQVLDILETRHPDPVQNDGDVSGSEQIELLRPDDTGTRRALKEAVVRGAPVSFAVQLHWSARAIDPGSVPPLAIFKAYTLYAVESRRTSRSAFFLRLGFFRDPIAAKQVALYVRSSFASAAVVPVLDEEITHAREACVDVSSIPCLVQQRIEQPLELGVIAAWSNSSKPESSQRRSASQGGETLEQTLAQLAEREMWDNPDLLSDTGVRHLKVEVQAKTAGRRH